MGEELKVVLESWIENRRFLPLLFTASVSSAELLFATTRSVFKSAKVSVVEIAKRTN